MSGGPQERRDGQDPHDADDRLERLLQEDGQRWRDGVVVPSLDDALRPLALPGAEGARSGDRPTASHSSRQAHGWWRPLAVAAAVLVLVGTAGVVASSVRGREGAAAPGPATGVTAPPSVGPTSAPSAGDDEAAGLPLPGLTRLPPGFAYWREVLVGSSSAQSDGGATSAAAATSQPLPPGEVGRVYTLGGDGATESAGVIALLVQPDTLSGTDAGRSTDVVRGHPAFVRDTGCDAAGARCSINVGWAEGDGRMVVLRYSGPSHASGRSALTRAQVLDLARSYRPGPG